MSPEFMSAAPSVLQLPVGSLSEQIRAACILEAAARKPGNVHPGASFANLEFADFLRAANAAADHLTSCQPHNLGECVLAAVQAAARVTQSNANLGMILLLAPLVAAGVGCTTERMFEVVSGIDLPQTELIYQAIAGARPGGMGKVSKEDLSLRPTVPIAAAMQLAADRDLVARQYAMGFEDVLFHGVPHFTNLLRHGQSWEEAIVGTHLWELARASDTLIARKCGPEVARECQARAIDCLDAAEPFDLSSSPHLRELDDWLRADGNRRNPGSTADLLAAIVFVAIRDRGWHPPREIILQQTVS